MYSGKDGSILANFFGTDDPNFRGGARPAVGDLNADGHMDLIVAAGFGGGPRVAFYDGTTTTRKGGPAKLINDIFVFEQSLRNGVFVAAGDLNGDGFAELIVGGGPGGGPRVLALSGQSLLLVDSDQATPVANLFAGNPNNRGGVRVAAKDLDGDGRADLIVGDGDDAGSLVSVYSGVSLTTSKSPTPQYTVNAFPGFNNGVYVG